MTVSLPVPNDTRAAAIKLTRRGWAVVPVPRGQKRPVIPEWQKLRLDEITASSYFDGNENIGILTGEPSGGLIDIDLDCDESVELAPAFLPTTTMRSGRTSRPRSHRWYVTDDSEELTKWRFPNINLGADEHLLVYASSKDRRVAGSELHANFKLGNSGEYLALVQPDGATVEHEYAPEFPAQNDDVSYGVSADLSTVGYFVTPTPAAPNAGDPIADPSRAIAISEIMYHPSSDNSLEEYIEIFNRGSQTVNLIGWQLDRGVEFTFLNVSMNAGQYLVVAADVAAFSAKYFTTVR